MKKVFFVIFLIALISLISLSLYTFARQTVYRLASPLPTVAPIPTEIMKEVTPQAITVKLGDKIYSFYFHEIKNNESLTLIPNFEEATFSGKIFKENNCSFGINGGFYKKEGGPLGLFQINGKKFGVQISSTTFNGFLTNCHSCESRNLNSGLSISSSSTAYSPSTSSSDFILQSGPLIFLKNQVQPNYIEEIYSRRSIIAKSTDGNFYLFSIFEKDNRLNGPRLKDLRDIFLSPDFIAGIPAFAGTSFDLILNLDGGSASAFYDKNIQVEEFKPIGSFLCGK